MTLFDLIRKFAKFVLSHSFSSVQCNLPFEVAEKIREWSLNIPTEDLATDGRENNIHVTVKYGLHNNDPYEIRPLLEGLKPIEIELGPISLFEGGEFDVVKISVKSPALIKLNKKISESFEHTDTHPNYIPHVTIAYVKPGKGLLYDGLKVFDGWKMKLNKILFSGNDNRETEFTLFKENREN